MSDGARIGKNCNLGQNVFIGKDCDIGDRVKIQNNVSVFSGVILEEDVFVGPSVVFTNVKTPRAFVDRSGEFFSTLVKKGASIGANSTVVCGNTIGQYAMIAAGAVVTKNVPDFALVQGVPARQVGWVDRNGEVRPRAPQGRLDKSVSALNPIAENSTIQDELERTVVELLRSGKFINGPAVEEFEGAVTRVLGCKYAVSCSSGTDAILMALMAAGVGPGDEVVTTPFSFISGVECILRLGATPVFVDVDPHSLLLDVNAVSQKLTARCKAFLPVHLYGQTVPLGGLRRILREREIALIEDAAQCFGGRDNNGRIGNTEGVATFSFFPSKNLGGFGDAGLVATNNEETARVLHSLRAHGTRSRHHHSRIGGNFRMDTFQAGLLNVKLNRLDQFIEARRAIAARYDVALGALGLGPHILQLPQSTPGHHTYNQYTVQVQKRDALHQHLRDQRIESAIHYPMPLHTQPALGDHRSPLGSFPIAEQACVRVLSLPIHPFLSATEQERVIRTIGDFFSR